MSSAQPFRIFCLVICTTLVAVLFILPAAAQDAAALYKPKCAMCHGADGKGDTPVGKKMGIHDLRSDEVQNMKDADIATIISDGKNKMPGYKKSLSPDQIKELVAYVRSFGKK
jgi:cytochrome c6